MSDSTLSPAGGEATRVVDCIPAALFHAHPARPVILRTPDPAEPPALLGPDVPAGVSYLQITDLGQDITPLADWGEGLPLDLVMADPAVELPLLYRCTVLLPRHPVRVTVPLWPGVANAVKLAVALGFAVRLTGHQPTPETVAEVRHALDGYLHNPTVAQPVEPFQSLLVAFLHDTPASLWSLLEQDPAQVRMLDGQGQPTPGQGPASVQDFRDRLVAQGAECRGCEWLPVCGGYFKWPRADYPCTDVKRLFADLKAAAADLREGLAAFEAAQGRENHGV